MPAPAPRGSPSGSNASGTSAATARSSSTRHSVRAPTTRRSTARPRTPPTRAGSPPTPRRRAASRSTSTSSTSCRRSSAASATTRWAAATSSTATSITRSAAVAVGSCAVTVPQDANSPVTTDGAERLEPGVALCLSGGGYRAMPFHVGALWRLNELGFLPKLDRVSSVSGGSITAVTLGRHWDRLQLDGAGVAQAFTAQVVAPLRQVASTTIDRSSVIAGILQPRRTVAEKVAEAYRQHL